MFLQLFTVTGDGGLKYGFEVEGLKFTCLQDSIFMDLQLRAAMSFSEGANLQAP